MENVKPNETGGETPGGQTRRLRFKKPFNERLLARLTVVGVMLALTLAAMYVNNDSGGRLGESVNDQISQNPALRGITSLASGLTDSVRSMLGREKETEGDGDLNGGEPFFEDERIYTGERIDEDILSEIRGRGDAYNKNKD